MNKFSTGDTVQFDPNSFNPNWFLKSLSEEERVKFYGRFGYGGRLKSFTFLCEHYPQSGHCVLMDIDTGELLPMCHMSDFRLLRDEEC